MRQKNEFTKCHIESSPPRDNAIAPDLVEVLGHDRLTGQKLSWKGVTVKIGRNSLMAWLNKGHLAY